jgi:hypothetical protein
MCAARIRSAISSADGASVSNETALSITNGA